MRILMITVFLFFFIFASYSENNRYFKDISEQSGIQKRNFITDPLRPIPINDHSRLRVADINNDGFDDIIMHTLYPNPLKGIPFETLVFLNNKDKTFSDFTDESGLKDIQAGFMLFADFDNDGDQDAFAGLDIPLGDCVNNLILENNGKGHFTVKQDSGVKLLENSYTATASASDFNNDGKLDLFVGNGGSAACVRDMIYKGNGNLTFEIVENSLDNDIPQPTNGCIAFDYDNDGDSDIYVSTYGVSVNKGHNKLWENIGDFRFINKASIKGVEAMPQGNRYTKTTEYGRIFERDDSGEIVYSKNTYIGSNGFGVDIWDFNMDGNMDIFNAAISHPSETAYSRKWSDSSMLLINRGKKGAFRFENESIKRDIPYCEGEIDCAAIDFDNDGYGDISVSREKKYDSRYKEEKYKSWFGLFKGTPDGKFDDIGRNSGINDGGEYEKMKMGQNISWTDIEHDGDLDLIVGGRSTGKGRPNFIFENLTGQNNMFFAVKLTGDGKHVNRDAIGTRVVLKIEKNLFIQDLVSSRGTYCSQDSRILYFGLEKFKDYITDENYSIEIIWPNGKKKDITKKIIFNKINNFIY